MLFAPTDLATVVRLVTSMYELVSIHHVLECREQGQDLTPLWVMYATSATQLSMVKQILDLCISEIDQQSHSPFSGVKCFNKVSNFIFGGTSFKETSLQIFR